MLRMRVGLCRRHSRRHGKISRNHRLPEPVARFIEVQPVGQEKLGARQAVGREHGVENIDVARVRHGLHIIGHQGVGFPDLGKQRQPQGAGLDRDIADAGIREFSPDAAHEIGKAAQHAVGRAALGQVVVACIHHDMPGLVLDHQFAHQRIAVAHGRAAKTPVEQDGQLPEVLRQMRPQANRRAADEQHAVAGGALLFVGQSKSIQAALPAGKCSRGRRLRLRAVSLQARREGDFSVGRRGGCACKRQKRQKDPSMNQRTAALQGGT